ncbi:hypothetical protein Droror1_Dr00024556 [Drosera rotundifolia]
MIADDGGGAIKRRGLRRELLRRPQPLRWAQGTLGTAPPPGTGNAGQSSSIGQSSSTGHSSSAGLRTPTSGSQYSFPPTSGSSRMW